MNNYLASAFSPSQTAIVIIVAVVGVILIALNIVLAYLFHKRGERKLYDLLLQQQREMLMQQLEEMRAKGTEGDDIPAAIQPFLHAQAAQPPTEETEEEAEEEEPEEELAPAEDDEDAVVEEEFVLDGKVVRYNRSFAARMIQSADQVKARYSELKNYLLSYKGVKSRISWKKDSFRLGRNTFATLAVRGKTLCLCLATDPARFAESKYKVIDLSVRSPKSKQPCMYRISAERRVKYAEELIDFILAELGAERTARESENFALPYETTERLLEKGLIRIIGEKAVPPESKVEPVEAEPQQESAEETVAEEVAIAEEAAEPAEEETDTEVGEELRNMTEQTEERSEEDAEELPAERSFEILEEVSVAEAEALGDEEAQELLEVKIVKKKKAGKKGIVNLDSLSKHFEAGAHVTVESLREKGLVAKDVQAIKVLAKGSLNKPLIVEADDFSLVAVKMIVLTGGRTIRRSSAREKGEKRKSE